MTQDFTVNSPLGNPSISAVVAVFPLAPPLCTSNIKSQQAGPAAFSLWLPAFLQLASKGSSGA